MTIPPIEDLVRPMDPSEDDYSPTRGFCSVDDIKAVFASIHKILTDQVGNIELTSQRVLDLASVLEDASKAFVALTSRVDDHMLELAEVREAIELTDRNVIELDTKRQAAEARENAINNQISDLLQHIRRLDTEINTMKVRLTTIEMSLGITP